MTPGVACRTISNFGVDIVAHVMWIGTNKEEWALDRY